MPREPALTNLKTSRAYMGGHDQIGRAHVWTPVTDQSRMPSSAWKKKKLNYLNRNVGICLNSNNLIHAYGPRKKVVTMSIKDTILEIKKKSNLKVTSIKNINDNW